MPCGLLWDSCGNLALFSWICVSFMLGKVSMDAGTLLKKIDSNSSIALDEFPPMSLEDLEFEKRLINRASLLKLFEGFPIENAVYSMPRFSVRSETEVEEDEAILDSDIESYLR